MIESVTIRDARNAPFQHTVDIPALETGTEIKFQPGINIIVGANGCGKSTLLNTIAAYTLCERAIKTPTGGGSIEDAMRSSRHLWNANGILDGVDVRHDYRGVVFRLRNIYEMGEEERLSSFDNFQATFAKQRMSMGQNTKLGLKQLFDAMFADQGIDYLTFPIEKLIALRDRVNDVWNERISQLLAYYKKNQITDIQEKDFEYTVLMDEPDRNLDIDNIDEVVGVLGTPKEMTQIIAAVHNPLIIGQLSKKSYINFIEMTPDYVSKVHDAIRKCRTLR